ncbi:MAG: gas vesicle protein GvpG [Desulfomonile tiedjei]|uniref:Gas vesicle protein GvpG n=1 Tax=Desulfomonile tiedjei TaxID=2358 RepID=A0A9D6V5C8_9BACT|nr:gas vesicle protein GvpG [Desulfomonile tiedjei]
MLLIDDILLFPVNGVLWIFDEIHNAADQELHNESDAITAQLQQLYAMLDAGKISEAEFDRQEGELLDRLDEIR